MAYESIHGTVGRSRWTPGQLWQVPTFFLGIFAVIGVALSAPLRQDPLVIQYDYELAALRQGLADNGPAEDLVARAELLLGRIDLFPRRMAETHFLAGSAYQRLAESSLPSTEARLKALNHLQQAEAMGLPAQLTSRLNYRLGQLFFQAGTDWAQAAVYLKKALEGGAEPLAPGYVLLTQAYLKQNPPDLDGALAANQKVLEYSDSEEAFLQRGEILVQKSLPQEALKALERVSSRAPSDLRRRALQLQTACCEEAGLWNRAIPLYKELLTDAGALPGGKARLLYVLGNCYQNADPPDEVAAIRAWEEVLEIGGEESQAAGLRLVEVHLHADPVDTTRILNILERALAEVKSPQEFHNGLVKLERAREILDSLGLILQETTAPEPAERLAELYRKLAPPGGAEERLGQAAEARARDLEAKGADQEMVRNEFSKAGAAFDKAAGALPASAQAGALWRSANCYLAAKDYFRSAGVLERFVALENADPRLAEAFLHLAETHQAIGQKDKARQAYYKCIEFPDTPFAYRARYQLALEELELGNLEQGQAILKQNLGVSGPALDREAHEKSLYKLAALLYQRQVFDQAYLFLREAARQYPNNANAALVRDQLGDCYRKLADQADKKLKAAKNPEGQAHYRSNRQVWLEQAALTYQELADDLESRTETQPLSTVEQALLRKAIFAAADLRFDLNDFPEALRRYQVLLGKYRKQIEGLVACQRIWRLCGVMVETPEQARKAREATLTAVNQIKEDLATMPAEHEAFQGPPGVWRKDDWMNWIRWVDLQLNPSVTSQATPRAPG